MAGEESDGNDDGSTSAVAIILPLYAVSPRLRVRRVE
jgi:hypothetical protein